MSYYFESIESKMMLPKENFNRALGALKEKVMSAEIEHNPPMRINFEDFMDEMHCDIIFDSEDNCVGMKRRDDTGYNDNLIVFQTLTPFFTEDSYIRFKGEDRAIWEFRMANGKFEKITIKEPEY